MLNAKLVVVGGDVKTTEVKLKLPCIIGRGKGSNITLLQPLVSRQHCELYEAGGRLRVRDLGSLNGTYVNNEKIDEAELPPNELLTVGTVTFRAVYEPLPSTEAPTAPVPQFMPSKAQPDDEEQPTVRVDAPVVEDEFAPVEDFETAEEVAVEEVVEEIAVEEVAVEEEDDEAGMPSTPLFAFTDEPKTVPMPQRPAAPAKPAAPASVRPTIPMAVTPQAGAAPATPTPATPAPAAAPAPSPAPAPAEPAATEEDEDLNDFLRSLGGK